MRRKAFQKVAPPQLGSERNIRGRKGTELARRREKDASTTFEN